MQRQVTKRQVQVIQPTINAGFMQSTLAPVVKKRVAAYARVSTEHEEQQSVLTGFSLRSIPTRVSQAPIQNGAKASIAWSRTPLTERST